MTKSMRAKTKAFLAGLVLGLSALPWFSVPLAHADPLPSTLALGKKLKAVAVNNETHEALVLSEKPARLHRIELAGRTATAIDLPEEAEVLAVDEKRNLALVAIEDKKLAFVDLGSSQLLPETVSFEHEIEAIAVHGELGLAVVLEDEGDTVAFVDIAGRTALGSLKLKGKLEGVAIHRDRQKAYVVSADGNKLAVIDLKTRALESETSITKHAQHIVVDEKLNLAAIANKEKKRIEVVDLNTLQVVQTHENLPGQPYALALNPDTHTVTVATKEAHGLTLLELETKKLTPSYATLPEKSESVAVSVRYNLAVVTVHDNNEVRFVELPNPVPVLKEIVPPDVTVPAPAFALLAVGEHFVDSSRVYLDGKPLATRWKYPEHLEADVPADILKTAGLHSVKVVTPAPAGGESQTLTFTAKNPVPVLTAVNPAEVFAKKGNQAIALIGRQFLPTSEVFFGAQKLAATYVDETKLTAVIPGTLLLESGVVPITVFNPAPGGGSSGFVNLTVRKAGPSISGFTPKEGPVGTTVTITGDNFDALSPGSNRVKFNGTLATVVQASATQIKAIVPLAATTGPISVANAEGEETSVEPFTVQPTEDFKISLAPGTLKLPLGGNSSALVSLTSTGLKPYQQLVELSVTGLPTGVTASFGTARLSALQPVLVTLKSDAAVSPGTYTVTVEAKGLSDGRTVARTQAFMLEILAAGTTTLSGRVLHAEDDRPFVGAVIRLGTESAITDEAGQYRFINPVLRGDQVILIDGHTNNTVAVEYPSSIAMPVMIVDGKDNLALTSYLQGVDTSRYTAIVPGNAASVTTPEIPNFELRIPAGATLTGWDGKPIDKIAVRTVSVDRLPIRPLPPDVNTRTVYLYYFFRAGGATPSTPIPVTMNNDVGALPGEKVDLWYYDESPTPDPNSNQWRIMGQGTVSADGKSIISDPGVGIPKFCCGASFPSPPPPPPPRAADGCGATGGNPVDLGSGIGSVFEDHGLGMKGLFPVRLSCRYNTMTANIGPFGRGTFLNYDWQARFSTQAITLITPDGIRYNLALDTDGAYRATPGRAGGYGIEARVEGGLTVVRFKDGTKYEFPRTGTQQLTAMVDPNGNRVTVSRDGSRAGGGRVTSLTDAKGRLYQFSYSGNLITQIRDPIGRTVSFAYDGSSRLIDATDPLGQKTRYAYDANHRVVEKTDTRGAITKHAYDDAGRTTEEILPDGSTYRFAYVASGGTVTETRMTDPNGNVTVYRWNGQGYEIRRTDALGRVFTKSVDYARNLLLAETDPLGRTTRYTYDGNGNRTSIKDAEGNLTLIEYDLTHNKPSVITNALGHVTQMAYDGKGHLTSLTNAEGETTTLTYTVQGKLATLTDPLGNVTRFTYDADGNLIETKDALGRTSQRAYDTANRLIQAVDAYGYATTYEYDSLDRLTKITDALGGLTRFAYDAKHNLLTVTDPKGAVIEINAYDLRNRITQRTDALGQSEAFGYDGMGNLITRTDRKGQATSITYDALNRVSRVAYADGRTTEFVYDLAGNVTQAIDSQSGEARYAYDSLNRLVSETTDRGVVSYQYDAIGRLTERRINGEDPTTYGYDKANRIKTIAYRNKAVAYVYDQAGSLTQRTLPNGIVQNYTWNEVNELTGIGYKKTDGTVLESVTYAYDALGNPIRRSRSGTASKQETGFTATYDTANRMLTFNGLPLTYDANGSLVSRQTPSGTVTYTWDASDRLTGISGPNGTASFKYDHAGRRIEKTINGVTTTYLYDGNQAIGEVQGSTVGTTYLTGLQIDEVLAIYGAKGNRTALTDALGSILALTDDTQATKTGYAYSPFGETAATGEASDQPYQYTGRENDGTGLYYYRERYYMPDLKRFASLDPIGLRGGLNSYAYVGNRPTVFRDPRGECPWCIGAAIGGVIGGVYGAIQAGNTHGWNNWQDIARGAAKGALTGALAGAIPTAWGPWAAAGLGGIIGGGAEIADQYQEKGAVCNWEKVAWDAGLGALGGGAGWNIGFASALSGVRNGLSRNEALNIGGALGGLVGGLPTLPPSPY